MNKPLSRLCIVGPQLGRHPGYVMSQGEILGDLFQQAGYTVKMTSSYPQPLFRIGDTVRSLLAWRRQIDVVILDVFSGRGFLFVDIASTLSRWLGLPQVQVLRGGNLPPFAAQYPRWVRRVLRQAQAIVPTSDYLAEFCKQVGLPSQIIPNVVKIENYPFRLRTAVQPTLLWMRTFHEAYHPEMAVEVARQLQQRYPQTRLTMAGADKGKLADVQALVQRYGLEEVVTFAGFLDMAGKQEHFARHDLYLHTNRVDNTPVSVLEAAAFGLPIIATNVGGIPYLLSDEETALLVPDSDVAAMAAAASRLIETPTLVNHLSSQARQLAESCAWEAVLKKWERLFSQLG